MNTQILMHKAIFMITLHGEDGDASEYTIQADKIAMIETRKNGNKPFTILTISPTGEEVVARE